MRSSLIWASFQLGSLKTDDRLEVIGQSGSANGALGSDPGAERVVELSLLRSPGLDAGSVPVNRAVKLGEGPAFDLRSRLEPEPRDRHLQPHPFARGWQFADPEPLGRAVPAPVDSIFTPVGSMRPVPARVPLEHQLLGRLERVDIDISKECIAFAELELVRGADRRIAA